MVDRGRFTDAPRWLTWSMTFINRIGFPIAVCIYLGYTQLKAFPLMLETLNNMNNTMMRLEGSIKENTALIRATRGQRRSRDDD